MSCHTAHSDCPSVTSTLGQDYNNTKNMITTIPESDQSRMHKKNGNWMQNETSAVPKF